MPGLHPKPWLVTEFLMPEDCQRQLGAVFAEGRGKREERMAYLGGTGVGQRVTLDTIVIPWQFALSTDEGCCIIVPGEAIDDAMDQLEREGKRVYFQVHTHPTEAYHSATDKATRALRFNGGLSLVVADFGIHPLLHDTSKLFRFDTDSAEWVALSTTQALQLMRIETETEVKVIDGRG